MKFTLQEVKLRQDDGQGYVNVFDGFAKHCSLLDHPLPALARIPFDYNNAFIINVSRSNGDSSLKVTCLYIVHTCTL